RWEQAGAAWRCENGLVRGAGAQRPARRQVDAVASLDRIVGERRVAQPALRERDQLAAGHVDLADAQPVREPALDAVTAGGQRDAAVDAVGLADLRCDETLAVHEVID